MKKKILTDYPRLATRLGVDSHEPHSLPNMTDRSLVGVLPVERAKLSTLALGRIGAIGRWQRNMLTGVPHGRSRDRGRKLSPTVVCEECTRSPRPAGLRASPP